MRQHPLFAFLDTNELNSNTKMDKAYIDGSKFEANANKYKFVWKPTTFHIKLSNKIRLLLNDYNLAREIPSEGITDSYIITQNRKDMENFIIIIEKHYEMHKIYPEAVYADAGYGSL